MVPPAALQDCQLNFIQKNSGHFCNKSHLLIQTINRKIIISLSSKIMYLQRIQKIYGNKTFFVLGFASIKIQTLFCTVFYVKTTFLRDLRRRLHWQMYRIRSISQCSLSHLTTPAKVVTN